MSDDPKCVAGCVPFYGGEKRHHKDCPYYPESLTKLNADRIEELEAKLDRYDDLVADKINLRSENVELKAKLAKVVGLLEAWVNVATHCTIEDGVCCCGDNMDTHAEPMDCGHSPVDHGAYIAMGLAEETETTLAELTGGKDE